MEVLEKKADTSWRISKRDVWQHKHYKKCQEAYLSFMKDTSLPSAPWYMIDAESRKWTELQVLEYLTQGIDIALSNQALAVPLLQNVFPMTQMPKLSEIPLDKSWMTIFIRKNWTGCRRVWENCIIVCIARRFL